MITRKLTKLGFLLVLVAIPSLYAAPIDPKNPPQGRFADEWAELYMTGKKVGYAHSTMTREGDFIHSAANFAMTVGRADAPVKVEISQFTKETLDGAPLTFGTEMRAATIKQSTAGAIDNGKVTITTSQLGMEQKKSFDFPDGALMNWGTLRESLIRGFKRGTKYTTKTYAPDLRLDDAVSATTEIGELEDLPRKPKSGETKGIRVTVKLESPMGVLEMVSWVNDSGEILLAKIPLPGMGDIDMVKSDQKSAMADFVPPEFFMTSTLKSPRKLDRAKINQITYRLKAKNPEAKFHDLPITDMQNVQCPPDSANPADSVGKPTEAEAGTKEQSAANKKCGTSADVVVTRQHHGKDKSNQASSAKKIDVAEFLEPNLMINTEDPELIKLAKQAAGNEKDPYKLADKLRRFVTEYVAGKNLNIGFATASEVARTKEGDCSEHGVLLTALARINGLPSRVAVGIAYVPIFGNADDIFGYHMWTQVYIDGRWIDIDAALRETECSPARIVFAVSSLRDAGIADISMPLISKIGAIDLEILDVK